MAMVRKQIYLEKVQDEALKRLARDLSLSEAEIIRRAIDLLIESQTQYRVVGGSGGSVREVATAPYGAVMEAETRNNLARSGVTQRYSRRLDDEAWQEELAFIEERARSLTHGGSTVKWRREDSYDNRRLRLPG